MARGSQLDDEVSNYPRYRRVGLKLIPTIEGAESIALEEALENVADAESSFIRWLPRKLRELIRREEPGLCKMCQRIDLHDTYGFGHYRHKALQWSAEFGCFLCQFFLTHIPKVDNFADADLNIRLNHSLLTYKYAGFREEVFEIFADYNMTKLISYRPTWKNPLEQGCISLVRKWLSNCCKNHPQCSQPSRRIAPTRIIDISQRDPFLEVNPPPNVPYIILSYCWGTGAVLSTTVDNFVRHQRQIGFDEMPNTFKDAIRVARELGFDFIWIDSLCIIQDRKDDWESECQKMGEYYSDAYLSISVLDSASCDDGFLAPRPELPRTRLANYSSVYIRKPMPRRREIFANAALNKRGWTLQERLLSTRILHCSNSEMFWECQTCSTSESDASEHREAVDTRSLVYSEGEDFKRILLHLPKYAKTNRDTVFRIWYHLVKHFSRRYLSRSSDALPAVSAIARNFATGTSLTYIVGLWAEDLQGLLWARAPRGTKEWKCYAYWEEENFRAPSWSWAAVDGELRFPFSDEERTHSPNDAMFCGHSLLPRGNDYYGEYGNGSITIRALSKRVQCAPKSVYHRYSKYVDNYVKSPELYTVAPKKKYYNGEIPYDLDLFDVVGEKFGVGICDDTELRNMISTCEAIWTAEYLYEGREANRAVYFLLLVPDDRKPNQWRRVGMGVTRDMPSHQGFFTSVYDNYDWKEFELV